MPKTKTSAQQPSLFKREIPHMPEGYYSSGPNPNLRRFVEEHATPYDPETDDYHVPPFDQPITTTKATAIYNMHTYWSKKPHDAIRQYIRHYTQPEDIVLDPMCGSGGAALAALMEGRAAIAIDLSPAATFITKNYCTPVDVEELQRAFEELQAKVKPEMDWLYETRCDRCDGRATTGYTVYSYVFQCTRCLEKVPLFDCVDAEGQTATGRPKKIKACPYCYARGHIEEISTTRSQRFDSVPVLVSYRCEEGCKPKRGERRHNDSDRKKRAFFEKYDMGKLRQIETKEIPYWYPSHRMMNVESDTEPWGDKWRAGTSNFRTVAELYTKRNLWALALVRSELLTLCEPAASSYAAPIWAAVSTVSLTGSRMLRESKRAIQPGAYYIPQISREIKIWTGIEYNVLQVAKGLAEMSEIAREPWNACISTQSACDLAEISDNQIDYVFTDPPYAGNVQYGELNFIWEAWLGFNTHWHNEEIIVNETRDKTDADWARMIQKAMSECYRVLKPGRWISLCYHDTSEGTWQLVQDLMTEVGFIPESTEAALYIDTAQKSFNQLMAEKVTRRDLVINFRKPRPGELLAQLTLFGDEDAATFVEKARAILREALEAHPGSSADRLYDELVSRMVRKGEFERHDFDQLLRSVAEDPRGDGRWYLLETADQVDEAESTKEAAAAAHLETFVGTYLDEHPEEAGVHYSDLFEQYLPVGDKPRRLLQDWLPEYFFRTPEGTWRPPATDEERAQKEALRASGALRRIKRFGRALLEGVPPHDRDRPANTATAADWIRQCRRAGLYDLGRALYEKGGFRFDELGDEGQLEAEEDYQVCVRRSG
jgi:DNA modification methylase